MRTELDPGPLLDALAAQGRPLALPVVRGPGRPLEFRRWVPGDPLEEGAYGTRHPLPSPAVFPEVLLVPLLAFDQVGNRLGYGGGYYDRTLADLRTSGRVHAIGLAYEAQRRTDIPVEQTDQRLDGIATEIGFRLVP